MGGGSSRNKTEPRGEGVKLAFDPDEKWSNLYREREKNHLYKWVAVRKGGELINIYERDGEEGVLKFAEEKLLTILYDEGQNPKLVTYSDYIKWKKGVNVQLGLSEESVDMQQSRFKEHYALWKLNKRGVEGENLIHLLLNREQQVCYEIARILLKRFPGMANDIYLGDEQFGQSALHLAIVHDDYETVSLLLNSKADVNARACGNFFLPEDFKLTNKITDYQGYAYYGEYPLAFAACFGNKDIYDLLIQFGANPNLQDSFGNTILHMCVINYSSSMYSYAVRHWAKPADPHVVNHAGFTPLTLATKLGRKQIFEEMLEIMKVEFWRFSDMTCSAYPLNTLDTIQPDGSTNYDSALMTVINGSTPEHLDMIGSEVIQRLLADKWKAFAQRKLIERLVLLIVQLITLSIVVYIRPTELPRLYMEDPQWDDYIRTACELLTILNCIFFVGYQQLGEIRTQGMRGYLRNLKTAPAKAVFCIANLFLLLCNVLKAMRYFLYASCTATFVSLTLAFGTQTRNIDNENSMGLLCDGFCKFLGPTFCATCYKAYATSVLTVNLINLHTLYYRTVCLKLINAQEIGRNTLIFSWHYLFIIAYLTSTLIPPSDHLAVYNETLAHYPEYDYTPYLNFGGFSQAQKVYLDNSTVAMFLVTLYFPMIGSYWKHQAMKLLKPHVSPNTSDATRVMFRKMIIGLNFQIFLPMLSYIPVVFLFILIQVTGHQFLISQYTWKTFQFWNYHLNSFYMF